MRILVVTQYFWPENFRINDLCAELVARGHQVVVLSGVPNYPEGEVFPAFRENPTHFDGYNGVEIVRVPMLPRKRGSIRLLLNYLSFALSASTIGPWKLRRKKFDVVFACQLSPVTIGLPAAFMAKLKRVPMAMWVLDLWPDSLSAVGAVRSPRVLGWVGKLVSYIYGRCDLIFAQSHSFIPRIAKLAPPSLRIEYSPSWAEDVFLQGEVSPAPEVPVRESTFNIMFAGNIGEAQDFPCILRAAERLKKYAHIRWLLVGDGRMAGWVEEEILRRGLKDTVLMLGRFPVERMPSFFRQADALLVTLSDEPIFAMTIPGKLQSYFAAGIPVVAALNGEGADVIRQANAGFAVPSGDDDALATAILSLSQMSVEERAAMGQRGKDYGQAEFNRKVVIDRIEARLNELSGKKNIRH